MNARRDVAALVAAMVLWAGEARAQDDSVPPIRHILAIDFGRIKPFRRSYDVVVAGADSTRVIGQRDISLSEAFTADSTPAWMLVESRSGAVSYVDSILLASDLRPVRWKSMLGPARLDIAFTSDSLSGTIRVGASGSRVSGAVPPDAVVSTAELELLGAVLPLSTGWSDSANALSVTVGGSLVEPTALAVVREDSVVVAPGMPARAAWVLAMRSGSKESRVWVDRENGDVLRAQQSLPSRVGAVLEYRIRFQPPTAP